MSIRWRVVAQFYGASTMARSTEPKRTMITTIDFPKVFCFGDSLTQRCFNITDGCWGSIIAARYQRQVDLIIRGFSGYNSRQAIYMLPRLLATRSTVGEAVSPAGSTGRSPSDGDPLSGGRPSIAALLVWFGANDASTPESDAHVPVDEYGDNLSLIIDQAVACGVPTSRIILVTPPEYDHSKWTEFKARDGIPAHQIGRAEGRSKMYAEKCLEIAKKRNTQLADVHRAMQADPDWRSLMVDGLHFNVRGAKFVADVLVRYLDPLVADLPIMFPLAGDMKRDNPKDELAKWMPPRTLN